MENKIHVGRAKYEEIRELCLKSDNYTATLNGLSPFEKFIHERGWVYKTEEALQAGYERACKTRRGEMLTEDEFIVEVMGEDGNPNYNNDTLKAVYARLVELVQKKILEPTEISGYAGHRWCLNSPDAIVAYQENWDIWHVNNCATEISEERAIVEINREWGFERSKIKIIGTPYYDATDWHFIRFDCCCMTWLWFNGNLHQVYYD